MLILFRDILTDPKLPAAGKSSCIIPTIPLVPSTSWLIVLSKMFRLFMPDPATPPLANMDRPIRKLVNVLVRRNTLLLTILPGL